MGATNTYMEDKPINLGLILEGCLRKNRYSQEKLYQHFYGYAMSICLRYAKNQEEAREILNDSFFKVFKKLNLYDKQYPFKIWLRRILINTAIDYYRKKQRKPLFIALENAAAIPDDSIDTFEIDPTINALPILQKLPPSYRIVFNLYVMEGYKHREIAEQLGISINTSKSNLARAKQKLKALIKNRTNYYIKYQGNG